MEKEKGNLAAVFAAYWSKTVSDTLALRRNHFETNKQTNERTNQEDRSRNHGLASTSKPERKINAIGANSKLVKMNLYDTSCVYLL